MAPDRRPKRAVASPLALGGVDLRDRIADGALRAEELAAACAQAIAAREPEVQAFAWHDAAYLADQARRRDAERRSGRPIGSLHGLPVGLKDIIDTEGIPTENGTPLDAGRVPSRDAAVVARLKAAGAVIAGKTVSTELAYLAPSRTRNPVNSAHTPGGSSAGSAAAVAAGMIPFAVGTQTGGSVIRPAAFCGVVGFKPSFGRVPRTGILMQSPTLDTVGVFARNVADAAMVAEVLFGADPGDAATRPAPHPKLLATACAKVPVPPTFAFVRTPYWDRAEGQTQAALAELAGRLGDQCFEAELPGAFAEAADLRQRINFAEMAKFYHGYAARGGEALSEQIRAAIAEGCEVRARDYLAALDWPHVYHAGLGEIFARCDAILTPAATGPAPEGLGSTGDAIFNGLWTLCGTPAITLPLFEAKNGLPMGLQLVGRRGDDARLLRTARWLEDWTRTLE